MTATKQHTGTEKTNNTPKHPGKDYIEAWAATLGIPVGEAAALLASWAADPHEHAEPDATDFLKNFPSASKAELNAFQCGANEGWDAGFGAGFDTGFKGGWNGALKYVRKCATTTK